MTYSPDISPNASKQEIFDFVVKKMFAQGKQSVKEGGAGHGVSCAYRSGDLKCAVGFCLPDNLYDPSMDEYNLIPRVLVRKFPALHEKTVLKEENIAFLDELQNAHDAWDDNVGHTEDEGLVMRLVSVAKDFRLKDKVLFKTTINGRKYKRREIAALIASGKAR